MDYSVSIIVPVYNSEKYLSRSIDSVLSQPEASKVEIILVDDGSTDGSGAVCDRYAAENENISVIHQPNGGVSAARNTGIKAAGSDYLLFLDSDDYYEPGAFEKLFEGETADLVSFDYCINGDGDGVLDKKFERSYYHKDEFEDTLYRVMVFDTSFYSSCNKLFKRSIIVENGVEFPPGVKYGEDMIFVYTYIRYISSFRFIHECLYSYMLDESTAISSLNKSYEHCYEQFLWLRDYFGTLECDSEFLIGECEGLFVFRTILALEQAGEELGLFDSIRYIRSILNNDDFYNGYKKYNYTEFRTKHDEIMYGLINKKRALLLALFFKFNKLRSKILK